MGSFANSLIKGTVDVELIVSMLTFTDNAPSMMAIKFLVVERVAAVPSPTLVRKRLNYIEVSKR